MAGPKQARAGGSPGKARSPAAAQRSRQGGKGAGSRPAGGGAPRGRATGQGAGRGRPGQPAGAVSAREGASKAPAGAGVPRWLPLTTFILSLAGLGLSVYLTITHYTDTALAGCPVNATVNCTKVTTSPESIVFGIFPVAVLGLAFYVFMAAINSPWAWHADLAVIRWARLAGVLTGIAFVLYLVYVELFKVNAICEYCTGVHVITFALFALIMYTIATRPAQAGKTAASRAGAPAGRGSAG
jgi:uncharacterized membrane protein